MKHIQKNTEPNCLECFRKQPDARFNDLDQQTKKELKESLLNEQGYICCYCGKRIELDNRTILEHLACQKDHDDLALNYDNILASCDGGQGDRAWKPRHERLRYPSHCDSHKGDAKLDITPLCVDCEEHFLYLDDGQIISSTPEGKQAIEILALDCSTVKNARSSAADVYRDLKEILKGINTTREFWQNEIEKATSLNPEGKYLPYCFFVKYFIETFCMPIVN